MLAEEAFQAVDRPVASGCQRASGLRFADPRVHSVLHAIITFRQLPDGFRAADLRQHLATLHGRDPASISQGAITYQLRRLCLHSLIERVSKSFRYRVTDHGLRVALFFTRLYNRILRPGSADLLLNLGPLANILNRACATFDARIKTMIDQASFAPRNLTHPRRVSF